MDILNSYVTQEQVTSYQKQRKFNKAYQLYYSSQIDKANPETRTMKCLFYKILSQTYYYNPENDTIINDSYDFKISMLNNFSKTDPLYEKKVISILLILYYITKNRAFNYAFKHNCSHCEYSQTEYMREWLENNYDSVVNGNANIRCVLDKFMLLIYDKLLVGRIRLFHQGETVVTGSTTLITDSFAFTQLDKRNTSRYQSIKGIDLIQKSEMLPQYKQRRDFWCQQITEPTLKKCKNSFLNDIYDLKEINAYLAFFDFQLYRIATKSGASMMYDEMQYSARSLQAVADVFKKDEDTETPYVTFYTVMHSSVLHILFYRKKYSLFK